MVDGNASMYLGSPRMAEMVIGEKVTLEEMGGARMHCSVSGCGDVLVESEQEAIEFARRYLTYFPANFRKKPTVIERQEIASFEKSITEIIPENQNVPFNMYDLIDRLIDQDSLRSEEHTSKLQSRSHIVCRLMLAKNKILKTMFYNRDT